MPIRQLPAIAAPRDAATKHYTLRIEPAGHPEARYEVVVEAGDDGDAYDQAIDHAAAESPYHCTIAITKVDEIGADARRLAA
ncbi:MAG: hypothetical protein JO305_08135 [Alphaproteobacteria bacterium]|nr:hypothetical protein [Alphaproteobacteria bacterium]MBV9826456.1 hypothetical protein [Alphaproteobacteria bacterium]